MAKRFLFGWAGFKAKEGKTRGYKVLNLGQSDEFWHGIKMSSVFCSDSISIPNCAPGSIVDVDFNEKGYVEGIALVKDNG